MRRYVVYTPFGGHYTEGNTGEAAWTRAWCKFFHQVPYGRVVRAMKVLGFKCCLAGPRML